MNHTNIPLPPPGKQGWPWTAPEAGSPAGGSWPKVTVVMPSYNQEQFLEQAVRSVLLQGYPNLEFFIYDGGSTDGSVEIIRKYAPFVDYWVSERDNGQSDAINRGFQRAAGKYIAWLNSDDLYLPGCLAKLVAALESSPEAGMAYGRVEVIDSLNRKIGTFEDAGSRVEDLLFFEAIIPQQAALFRRSTVEQAGLLRVDLDYAMDHEFFIRLGMHAPILPVDELLAQFRLSDSNKGVAQRTRWAPEFVRIAETLFADPNLKPAYAGLKNRSLAGAYFRGGATYLESFDTRAALGWFVKAAKIYPKYLLRLRWWKKLVRALAGRWGNQAFLDARVFLRRLGIYRKESDWQTGQMVWQKLDDQDYS